MRYSSSAENATWDILIPRSKTKCGVNGFVFPPPDTSAVNAFRTASVLATTTDVGPPAASIPLREAMLSKDAVVGGKLSDGHGVGSNWSFMSPAIL